MAESFSREKLRHASSCVTPAGTSKKLDVQNEWEENTHAHTVKTPKRRLHHTSSRSPPPRNTVVFQFFLFSMTCGLEKLRLDDQD